MGDAVFAWDNRAIAAATVITATASDPDHPSSWLRLRQRANKWRSPIGWTIAADFNDTINFIRGGSFFAVIAPGTYLSGTEMAAAVVAAMEAADPTPVWACSYGSTTHLFTLSADLAFSVPWLTGSPASQLVSADLGFTADDGSATVHVGDLAVYQSRHTITFDLGSAMAVEAAAVLDFNGSAVTVAAGASDPPSAFTKTPTAGESVFASFFGAVSYRYWRFLLDARFNADGYTEMAVPFLGPTFGLPAHLDRSYSRGRLDYSIVMRARQGAAYSSPQQTAKSWGVAYLPVSQAQRTEMMAGAPRKGVPFFWARDADVPAETFYVLTEQDLAASFIHTDAGDWELGLQLQEQPR